MDDFVLCTIAWAICIVLVIGSVVGGITYTYTTWNEQKRDIITSCVESGKSWSHVPNSSSGSIGMEFECV